MSFAKPDNFKEFYIDKQKLLYLKYLDGKKHENGFMIVAVEGAYTLLVRKTILYFPKERQQPYSEPRPDRFEAKKDTYYIATPNQLVIKLTSAKKMFKSIPEAELLLRSFPIKTIDFDNLDDLIKLVEQLNIQKPGN
jgi:hypothetical protein